MLQKGKIMLDIPLMKNNIKKEDIECLIDFLNKAKIFTQHDNVREFERKWSEWLGVKYSVFVNSGSSANFITMAVLKELYGKGEIIVPTITWSSDIASVITAGFSPVFVDINLKNLAMDETGILDAITSNTVAVFLTHVLGFNGLSEALIYELDRRNILLIEDVCESHGASLNEKKVGNFGKASNFSFYYAHHMSTIEGGMVCTNDEKFYQYARLYRSHGLLRESTDKELNNQIEKKYPEVNRDFLFLLPGYNMRSTELNAVIGINQLKSLDANNEKRKKNFKSFLDNLDKDRFYTDFFLEGSVNYAFTILLREKNNDLLKQIVKKLQNENVDIRRGMVSGNIVRQPFVRNVLPTVDPAVFENAEHIHFYGLYTGNYPDLENEKIIRLCEILNNI
jgi:CDP-6-deoxy-D-xylo-4-hexulose-3-dehydrase